jgi:hypothetical protein
MDVRFALRHQENYVVKMCFDKSFASHEKSKYIINNDIPINLIFKNSNKTYEFKCEICNHIFICAYMTF